MVGLHPLFKNVTLLILVFLKSFEFASHKKWAVGVNNISYPYVTCLSSWVTALLEVLVRKPSGFKILLYDCHLLFTFCLRVSEWNQWCQTLLCSWLYSLKIVHFCNTEDVVLNLFMVFHASNMSLCTECISATLWAEELCLRQKAAQQLCKAWQVCECLGSRGDTSGSTWGAAQVDQGTANLAVLGEF